MNSAIINLVIVAIISYLIALVPELTWKVLLVMALILNAAEVISALK